MKHFSLALLLVSLGLFTACRGKWGDSVPIKTDASIPPPVASAASGQYDGIRKLEVSLQGEGIIRYTLDGSIPDVSSPRYRSPFKFKKTTILRAVSFVGDSTCSPVATYTYLINEGHQMDVLSLVSDPDGLFSSKTGIYATGPYRLMPFGKKGNGKRRLAYPYEEANFWQKWWRQAHVTLLPQDGEGFSADCGTAIFGGYSRAEKKKSFKFKFDETYGADSLHYRLFPNRACDVYSSFVVRAGSDGMGSLIKDELVDVLADGLMDMSATRPVVLYVNDLYFGVYFLHEKINRQFIAGHHNIPTDSLDIIYRNIESEEGSDKDWKDLAGYVSSHDITQDEVYQYVADRIDVQGYADWLVTELWCDNWDISNVRTFRSPFLDHKWHWILYDVDQGFNAPDSDGFIALFTPVEKESIYYDPFRCLLRHPSFRELFLSRLEYQMKTLYPRDRVRGAIDDLVGVIGPEMKRNQERWVRSYEHWLEKIDALYLFADKRQSCLKQIFATNPYLQDLLHMTPEELDRCFPDALKKTVSRAPR